MVAGLGYPLVRQLVISFQEYGLAQQFGRPAEWVGLRNYAEIADDPTFWTAFGNTVLFTGISVPLGIATGLGAALLLNKALPARGLLRGLVYLPVVVSGV